MIPLVEREIKGQQNYASRTRREICDLDAFVLNAVPHADVVRREQPLSEVEVRAPLRQGFKRRAGILYNKPLHR